MSDGLWHRCRSVCVSRETPFVPVQLQRSGRLCRTRQAGRIAAPRSGTHTQTHKHRRARVDSKHFTRLLCCTTRTLLPPKRWCACFCSIKRSEQPCVKSKKKKKKQSYPNGKEKQLQTIDCCTLFDRRTNTPPPPAIFLPNEQINVLLQ